jgi:4-amino-4-deoxy-L-arabinose transferase-like glycosyltransferase
MRATDDSRARWEVTALAAAVLLALALRVHGLGWGLPSVFEEAMPFKKAWDMWGFGPLRQFDPNPHWFQYPSLVFYLQLAGQAFTFALLRVTGAAHSTLDLRVLYEMDKTPYYLVGRSITALFGAATVLPVWALARRAAGARAAVVAALLVAIHPGLIAKSQVIEVDVPLTCLVTAGLALAAALVERPTGRACLLAGAVAGFATSAKYPGLVLLAPLMFAVWRSRAAGTPRRGAVTGRSTGLPARAGLVLIGLAGALFLTSPYLILDFRSVRGDLGVGRQLMTAGHFGVAAGTAYGTYALNWFASLMGWPLGLAALGGLAWGAARRRPWALVVLALFLPYVAVVGSWQMKADRYLLPLVPAGIVCGAALLAEIAAALPALASPRAAALAMALGGVACGAPLAAMLPAHWAALRTDTRELARRWIEGHLPRGSFIACEQYAPDLLSPLELQQTDAEVTARLERLGRLSRLYAVQTIPMFVMVPQRSAKFYALERYDLADAVVVTSSVRERYRGDPARYAAQLAFYEALEARWPRIAAFEPGRGPGPAIAIYRNPAAAAPFAERRGIPPPDSTIATSAPVTGAEGFHYYNLGLNCEAFGFVPEAQASYLLALRFGGSEPVTYVIAGVRLAQSLWGQGRRGAALALLRECQARAPGPREATQLAQAGAALLSGAEISAPLGR